MQRGLLVHSLMICVCLSAGKVDARGSQLHVLIIVLVVRTMMHVPIGVTAPSRCME